MSNLVPACHLCNRQKGDKTPAELYIGWDLRHRWSGKGTAQKSDTSGLSLRGMYMPIHEEVLGLLDDLDRVAAEIADRRRRDWFLWASPWTYHYDLGINYYRRRFTEEVQKAKAEGWPDNRPESVKKRSA